MAIEFTSIDPESKDLIEKFVKEQLESKTGPVVLGKLDKK